MEEKELLGEERIPERPDYGEELKNILQGDFPEDEIREKLDDYHENDIAGILPELTTGERKKLYRLLGVERVSEVLSYLEEDEVEGFFEEMDENAAADILENMDADDAADILEELEDDRSEVIRNLMEEEAREDVELIQSYDEDEIGSRMTNNFIEIREDSSVREAMKELIRQAADHDNIAILFVTDEEEHYRGAIDLKDLIVARDYMQLSDLISTSFPYVYAKEKIADCIEELKDYSEDAIPVLDNDRKLLGVITSQNLMETVDDELSEDYAKLAGLPEEEDMNEPLKESVKKRFPWLCLLMFLGLGVSAVVGLFEPVVAQLAVLVSFQSLILDMAGNVGTQSLAVTIRVLMDDGIEMKQQMGLIWKEVRIGLFNGLLIGGSSFLVVTGYVLFLQKRSPLFAVSVSLCIGAALLCAMVISAFMGTAIPIVFKKIGFDPAVASGPLITTCNDLVAVVSYYGLAWLFLIQTLHLAG